MTNDAPCWNTGTGHGGPKMKRKVNKEIKLTIYKLVDTNRCKAIDDEVMCQTIHGFAGYRIPFNSRRPQHHASIDTRGNNGPLWHHNS